MGCGTITGTAAGDGTPAGVGTVGMDQAMAGDGIAGTVPDGEWDGTIGTDPITAGQATDTITLITIHITAEFVAFETICMADRLGTLPTERIPPVEESTQIIPIHATVPTAEHGTKTRPRPEILFAPAPLPATETQITTLLLPGRKRSRPQEIIPIHLHEAPHPVQELFDLQVAADDRPAVA